MQRRSRKPDAHDIAAEIIRRAGAAAGSGHVIRLSTLPARHELLQLLAARLERRPIRDHAAQVQDGGGMDGAVRAAE